MNKKDPRKVRFFSYEIREAKHGKGYYLSLFLLFFAIPLYVLLQFLYVEAKGWTLLDLAFILILLAIAISGLYTEFASKTKLPLWITVVGVISGVVVTIVQIIFNYIF